MAHRIKTDVNIDGTLQVRDTGGVNELLVSDGVTRVYSTLRLDSDIQLAGGYGSAGQVLTSQGSGTAVTWSTVSGGGGTMDDWLLNVDNGTGTWPTTISDGETAEFIGGTNISTVGSFPSAGGNRVTISQDQYYQTFHFNNSDKNTGGTYYMEWDAAGAQTSLNQQCQYIPLRNGDFTKIKWFSAVAVSGNIIMSLENGTTTQLWTSGNFTSSANTAVNFTPNVSISENQRLNLKVVYPAGYGGGFNITAEFAWDL